MGVYIALDTSSLCNAELLWKVLQLLPRPTMAITPDEVLVRKQSYPHSSAQRQLEVLKFSWNTLWKKCDPSMSITPRVTRHQAVLGEERSPPFCPSLL